MEIALTSKQHDQIERLKDELADLRDAGADREVLATHAQVIEAMTRLGRDHAEAVRFVEESYAYAT